MTYTQLRSSIIEFIIEAVDVTVIRANQSAPRPDPPYISTNITSINIMGSPYYGYADTNGNQKIDHTLELSVSVQGYGPTILDELQKLKLYIHREEGRVSLQNKCFAFMRDAGPTENSVTLDITTEERYLYEFFLNTKITDIENVSYIETVEITDTILN